MKVVLWVFLGLFQLFQIPVRADIPEGYILEVKGECGADGIEDAVITMTSDLEATAIAKCADGDVVFTDHDTVNLQVSVSYPGQGSSPCVFQQRGGSVRVYVVVVIVSYGELGQPVHHGEEEYTITCTYDDNGQNRTSPQRLSEELIAPLEVQGHAGSSEYGTKFTLTLTDILGNDLNDPIAIGRIVQLKANTSGDLSEKGSSPEACDALSEATGKRYAILRGGCGDGLVFQKNQGFTIEGTTSYSPRFEVFNLEGDDVVIFECNFTLCLGECNGNTCGYLPDRKRRSLQKTEFVLSSRPLRVR